MTAEMSWRLFLAVIVGIMAMVWVRNAAEKQDVSGAVGGALIIALIAYYIGYNIAYGEFYAYLAKMPRP